MPDILSLAPTDRADLARALFEESGDALFLFDPASAECVDANPVAQRLTGFCRDELRERTAADLIREEQSSDNRLARALDQPNRQPNGLDGFLLRSKTKIDDIPVSLTVTRLHLDRPLALVTARDVRDERAMLANVRQLEAEWWRVLGSVSDCLWSAEVDAAGHWEYRYVSPVIETITGLPAEHFLPSADRWLELTHPADMPVVQAVRRDLAAGKPAAVYEYRLLLPDGTVRWVRSSVRSSPTPAGRRIDGVVSDFSDQKRAEERLRESEARYRDLVEHTPIATYEEDFTAVGAWMADRRRRGVTDLRAYLAEHPDEVGVAARLVRVVDANREAVEQAGAADKADLLARLPRLFAEQARGGFVAELAALWAGRDEFEHESRGRRIDGRPMDVIVRLHVPRRDGQPDLGRVIVTRTDITDRRRAEEARDRERALLKSILSAIPDLISRTDDARTYRGCNAAFAAFFGMREEEVIGRKPDDIYPRDAAAALAAADAKILAGGPPERLELKLTTTDGRRVLFESLRVPLPGPTGRPAGLIGISRDITARRQLEDQLRQAGKLEAVGQLAGGVAHDFNNLLTAVLGNLSLAQSMLPDHHAVRELLAASDQAAWRAAELTRQLLAFARRQSVRLEPADVNASVAETLALLRRTLDPRIVIEARPDPRVGPALADLGQVSQVLMNLCLNARDAMPEGGTLTIESAGVTVDAAHARRVAAAKPGRFVRLRVADTGHGIPPEVRDRMFEPFFTTKEVGKGTGLGLALVHGIVTKHCGWVEVESTPGRGATFDVYLPRAAGDNAEPNVPSAETKPVTAHDSPPASRTILLADDEPMIRTLARSILEGQGYRVLLAVDGEEAVDLYRRELGLVDLVILDLTMPRLNGRDACRQLARIDPTVRVLLSSGFAADAAAATKEPGVRGFVAKPYRPADLVAAVRAALE
jgi:PAS domain S-box-containing protein